VRCIEAAHADLVAALRRHPVVTVDCTAVTDVDLSLIQLLLAARASAALAGKAVRLAGPAQGALHTALLAGGFLPDTPERAFWNAPEALVSETPVSKAPA
jgi:hypothetical protein